ncbi:T6SS immunity protein Tdi1 domain-containing protein [Pleionea sediminis]|uniref:T6SS immunity protein Tdi1 domain-containing protein n=1 Tax=Pleionea sediminis TaxID=2569479 RepID=UPI0013DE159E|nr:T6SS immunity protein Tdi1 domain-containing protein [Pleionea sediminis]
MLLDDISIAPHSVDWNKVLHYWDWLLAEQPEFSIWMVTPFAELITADSEGSVWFISTSGANYEKVADSKDDFLALIEDKEALDYFFMPSLVHELVESGMTLGQDECYSFITPNVFKECSFDPENFKVANIEDYLMGLGDLLGKLMKTEAGQTATLNDDGD